MMASWLEMLMGSGQTNPLFQGQPDPMAQAPLFGDPEAAMAARDSSAMEPVTGPYLKDVFTGQYAKQGLQNANDMFAHANAGDRDALAQIAMTFGPGAIRAYHGSPYDFSKFDISKIGTGEGAQAYGHGLYFAENPEVARSYKTDLSGGIAYKGQPFDDSIPIEGPGMSIPVHNIIKRLRETDETPEQAIANVRSMMADVAARYEKNLRNPNVSNIARQANSLSLENYKRGLDAFGNIDPTHFSRPGRMYEVNINAEPEQFLHWDKPLAGQPTNVRDTLLSVLGPAEQRRMAQWEPPSWSDYPRGARYEDTIKAGTIYNGMANGDAAGASNALRDAGIPGIRYADQGSRGAGDGTHNHVVFDDKIIEILRKYGLAGLLGGGAATALTGQANAQ